MHQFLAEMQNHIGKDLAVSGEYLAKVLNTNMRNVRHMTDEAIKQGIAVCSHPAHGYWIALNAEELEYTCQFHRSRALHELQKEARLRRMPLPDLLGQLHLKT
jgi:biotin operon repressor